MYKHDITIELTRLSYKATTLNLSHTVYLSLLFS